MPPQPHRDQAVITQFIDLLRNRVAGGKRMLQTGFDITPAMHQRAVDGVRLFQRAKQATGLPVRNVENLVRPIAKRLSIDLKVVDTAADLPITYPDDGRGLYVDGKMYVVTSAMRTRADIMRVVGHEAIAHLGLRVLLGPAGWKQFMNHISVATKMGNKALAEIRDYVRSQYVAENGQYNLSPAQEADEIAARAVELAIDTVAGEFKPGYGWLKSVFAKVAEFLRSIGITVPFTNLELQGALVNSMRNLERGARAPTGQVAAAARGGNSGLAGLVQDMRRVRGSEQAKAVRGEIVGKTKINAETGILATASAMSYGKMMSQSNVTGSVSSQAHYQALGNLDKLFGLATLRESRIPKNATDAGAVAQIRQFEVPMPFDGEVLRVKITAKEFVNAAQGTRVYLINAVEIESAGVTGYDPEVSGQFQHGTDAASAPPPGASERSSQMVDEVKTDCAYLRVSYADLRRR